MCDRPRLLNPLHHHPTILPLPQQLVSENPLCSERWDRLQRGRNSAIMSAFCRSLKLGNWSWGIKVITFWHSVPNSSINVLSVELVTEIVRSLSLQLYFWNSQSARSGRKFVRGFNRARDLGFGIAPIKKVEVRSIASLQKFKIRWAMRTLQISCSGEQEHSVLQKKSGLQNYSAHQS